ncbi:MAG: MG2 domain-containing protein [Terriglobia bacterium]
MDEAATVVSLGAQSLDTSLAVENRTAVALPVLCEIDLLDAENRVAAHGAISANVEPETRTIPVTLDLPGPSGKQNRSAWARQILWYRLRYRLTASPFLAGERFTEGILPVGRVLRNAFNLEVAAWRADARRRGYEALVRATHPFTGAPVEGVNLQASIALDEGSAVAQPATASEKTDASGHATLRFEVPAADLDRKAEMHVSGRLGGYEEDAEHEFDSPSPSILITTDKPLYQPGQVMHARALILGVSGPALAAAPVTLTVKDPDNAMVFRSELTASRFGVAHADWAIPDHQRLGTYALQVQLGRRSGYPANASIQISRYELPQFTVSVKPDRSYYLPGQNASVGGARRLLVWQTCQARPCERGPRRGARVELQGAEVGDKRGCQV